MSRNFNNRQSNPKREATPPAFIAYHVSDRGKTGYWTRIGAAWLHEDGEGLNLDLELIPASGGRIVLRTPKAKPAEDESGAETEEKGA